MQNIKVLFRRELLSYFTTPIAYVFIIIFLILSGALTFSLGRFFDHGQVDLQPFFMFLPWLYLILIPALTMRLWAEERKTGSIELLLTLPVKMTDAVLGKFLAAWAFTGISLLLTFPMWITANYLGDADNGVIVASYIGSFLMAGAFIAIGCCISATTKNQVIAFIITLVICLALDLSGTPLVLDYLPFPQFITDIISSFSFFSRFSDIIRGVISLRDIIYFCSLIAFWLFANTMVIEMKKAS